MCKNKVDGGLGVKNLTSFNASLLAKWRWIFLVEKDAMWSGLRAHRYGHLDRLGECQAWSRSAWRNYPTVVNFSFRSFWKCDVSSKVLTFS